MLFSSTAPAHPHAIGVSVYQALLLIIHLYSLPKDRTEPFLSRPQISSKLSIVPELKMASINCVAMQRAAFQCVAVIMMLLGLAAAMTENGDISVLVVKPKKTFKSMISSLSQVISSMSINRVTSTYYSYKHFRMLKYSYTLL